MRNISDRDCSDQRKMNKYAIDKGYSQRVLCSSSPFMMERKPYTHNLQYINNQNLMRKIEKNVAAVQTKEKESELCLVKDHNSSLRLSLFYADDTIQKAIKMKEDIGYYVPSSDGSRCFYELYNKTNGDTSVERDLREN